jgi:hypothetical protein
MEINNFSIIEPLMHFSEDRSTFYFIQLIKRRKDKGNEDMDRGERLVKAYFVDKPLTESLKKEMISIAKITNSRIYMTLSPCIKENVVKQCAKDFVDRVCNENYNGLHGVLHTACGLSTSCVGKLFLVDVDTKDEEYIERVEKIINGLSPASDINKIVLKVPTLNGYHLICKPFDRISFKLHFRDIDVHPHNPTLVYYNNNNI